MNTFIEMFLIEQSRVSLAFFVYRIVHTTVHVNSNIYPSSGDCGWIVKYPTGSHKT